MKCINHNHPDYKELNDIVSNRLILDKYIDDYQEANNTDEFPSVDYIREKAGLDHLLEGTKCPS